MATITIGPYPFSTAANDDSYGASAWLNVNNALVLDAVRATNAFDGGTPETLSNYLKITGPHHYIANDLPLDAVPTEIIIGVTRRNSGHDEGMEEVNDDRLRLVKQDTIQSDDQSKASDWPADDTVSEYTFALSGWTRADLIASTTGLVLSCTNTLSAGGLATAAVNYAFIKSITFTTNRVYRHSQTATRGLLRNRFGHN